MLEGATSETIVAGSNSGRRTGFIAADSSRDDRRFQTDVMLPAASRAAFRVFVLVHISAALGGVFTGSRKRSGQRMTTLGWIVLGLVGWALGLIIVLTLFRMAGDQDRAARHEQKRLDPYSDVTITQTGDR